MLEASEKASQNEMLGTTCFTRSLASDSQFQPIRLHLLNLMFKHAVMQHDNIDTYTAHLAKSRRSSRDLYSSSTEMSYLL